MPRASRKSLNTSFYHVIVQGVNKEFIFEKYQYRKKYLQFLKESKELYHIEIVAYAIMYNHAHLIIYTENTTDLSMFMKKVNENYGRYYNYIENRVGHVFRDRFLSEPITNQKYLLNCIVYIHNNPVKANIVNNCEDYRFSSYMDYINNTGFINQDIVELIFESKNINYNEYKAMHLKNTYYFSEYDDMKKENLKEILEEIEKRYAMSFKELAKDSKLLKKVILEIKDRINVSNYELSKLLKIDKNKIYRILK